jgi:FkbM family methyltransferase
MNRNLFGRILGIAEDLLGALRGSGLPPGKVFSREYVAAWGQFKDFAPDAVRVLVDIGAHEGLYASRAARYFSLSRTILVEPLPKFADNLRKLNLPGQEVVEAALSDKVGEATFTVNNTEQASSLLEINPDMSEAYRLDMVAGEKITVKMTTLDQLAADLKLDGIDLVKVDVQGAERELLAGAARILRKTKYVQIEVLFVEHYRGCARFFELDELLAKSGFRLCRLVDFSHSREGFLLQADAIYVNTGFAGRQGV